MLAASFLLTRLPIASKPKVSFCNILLLVQDVADESVSELHILSKKSFSYVDSIAQVFLWNEGKEDFLAWDY